MNIDLKQLEQNVNMYALSPGFKNAELHYIIATDNNTFRFVDWKEEPGEGEKKFYCFLTEKELLIPAGNIELKESYMLSEVPAYPLLTNAADFCSILNDIDEGGLAKGIRHFSEEAIDSIQKQLEISCGIVQKHMVKSAEAQHLLFLVKDVEISISSSMVYFRHKTFFSDQHYAHVKQESDAS